jgi:hypothetical protein
MWILIGFCLWLGLVLVYCLDNIVKFTKLSDIHYFSNIREFAYSQNALRAGWGGAR